MQLDNDLFVGEDIDTDVKSNLSRNEIIARLRDRNEPILLFGETELDVFKRLRKYELIEPETNKVNNIFLFNVECL